MQIRATKDFDQEHIQDVYWKAFFESDRELVSKLAINLLSEVTTPPIISLVAESDGAVVGHVAFSPVTFDRVENSSGYILALLAIKPDHQKQSIGSGIIESV